MLVLCASPSPYKYVYISTNLPVYLSTRIFSSYRSARLVYPVHLCITNLSVPRVYSYLIWCIYPPIRLYSYLVLYPAIQMSVSRLYQWFQYHIITFPSLLGKMDPHICMHGAKPSRLSTAHLSPTRFNSRTTNVNTSRKKVMPFSPALPSNK